MKIDVNKIWNKLPEETIKKFNVFTDILIEENQKYNLTAIRKKEDIIIKHFKDSISVIPIIEKLKNKNKIIGDFGTGAGFPGIPVKILKPEIKMELIESNGKKVFFQRKIIDILKLNDIFIKHCRMENFTNKNFFDIILCRSVCYLPMLMEITVPFLKKGGTLLAYKDSSILEKEEIKYAKKVFSFTKMKIVEIHEIEYDGIKRIIIEIVKKGFPDHGIPRQYAKIKKIWKEKCQK